MVTVAVEVAKRVGCVVCGKERFALKSPYVCHSCWVSGEAALMIQRLTPRALDGAGVCRVVNHVYVDGVCAECGSPEPPRK